MLSVVATPIGNLEDITLRAVSVLRACDVIVAEDTRVTKKLLTHFNIQNRTLSYHARSGEKGIEKVLDELRAGHHVALVTDAGTPAVSDPGSELVSRVRQELPEVKIETIPGPSALTAALSIAGVNTSEFVFLGFLPSKKGRKTRFAEIAESTRAVVFYESPHRIEKAIASLAEVLPEGRSVVVLRELTKMFEEVITGSPAEILAHFADTPNSLRGEFVVVVAP